MKKVLLVTFLILVVLDFLFADTITLYKGGYAYYSGEKAFLLKRGENKLIISYPSSVFMDSVALIPENKKVKVVNFSHKKETNSLFHFFERNIGKKISFLTYESKAKEEAVILENFPSYLILKNADKGVFIEKKDNIKRIFLKNNIFSSMANSVWTLKSSVKGKVNFDLIYKFSGLYWGAKYDLFLNRNEIGAEFKSYIILDNRTNHAFKDVFFKLLSGEVFSGSYGGIRNNDMLAMSKSVGRSTNSIESGNLSEYHIYKLPKEFSMAPYEKKIMPFFDTKRIKLKKMLVYPLFTNDAVMVMYNIKNKKSNNLGVAFPAGKISVYKKDKDGAFVFVGGTHIGNITEKKELLFSTGIAYDIKGKTKHLYRKKINETKKEKVYEKKVKITITNDGKKGNFIYVLVNREQNSKLVKILGDAKIFKKTDDTILIRVYVKKYSQKEFLLLFEERYQK